MNYSTVAVWKELRLFNLRGNNIVWDISGVICCDLSAWMKLEERHCGILCSQL